MAMDTVFDKTKPSCFLGTGLAEWLVEADVSELVDRRDENAVLYRHHLPHRSRARLSAGAGGRCSHLYGHASIASQGDYRAPQRDLEWPLREASEHD